MKKNLDLEKRTIKNDNIFTSSKNIINVLLSYDNLFKQIYSSKINFSIYEKIPTITSKENYSRFSVKKIKFIKNTENLIKTFSRKNRVKTKRNSYMKSMDFRKRNSSAFFKKIKFSKPTSLLKNKKINNRYKNRKSTKLRILLKDIKEKKLLLENLENKKIKNRFKKENRLKKKKQKNQINFKIIKTSKRKINKTMDEIYKKEKKKEHSDFKKKIFIIKKVKENENKSRIKFTIPILFKLKKKINFFRIKKRKKVN